MAQRRTPDLPGAAWPEGAIDAELQALLEFSPEAQRRARRWLLIAGVLALLGGVVAILVPAVASVATAIFVGWLLVFAGVVEGMRAFALRSRGAPVGLPALLAVLTFAAGACILLFPLTGVLTLTFFLVAWFLVTGALLLWGAYSYRHRPEAPLVGLNGAISLVLGVLIAADLPSSAGWAIGLLVGINLLFWGVRALIAANALRTVDG